MATNTSKQGDTAAGYGCLVLVVIVCSVGYWAYSGIDSIGWMQHEEDSVITAQANWFVGESKDCTSYPLDAKTAQSMNKPKGYAIAQINCDGGPEHSVKIAFFGRTEQPEYDWITWRCTRNESSFTCKQIANSPPHLTGTDKQTGRPVVSYDGGKTWQWADQ
jgi:hypothetical protein